MVDQKALDDRLKIGENVFSLCPYQKLLIFLSCDFCHIRVVTQQ
ncbi:MAG: hypothetical protein A4E37_02030 [Methanoregulaceae archaeon PtaB.Bin056]|nr:MAG: hypothetical protein A4E37_02030 [Methanoregulaceae archaeon PtaB.Bin056]